MPVTLNDILPNLATGLRETGFFFGAGASFEAGYPMMGTLTREVVSALSPSERDALDEALSAVGLSYDDATATPNIEEISDIVIAHWTNSGADRFGLLEGTLRDFILERILSVTSPDLTWHCRFFEALKKRAFGLPSCVWIFTTNYDVLFETAAALTGVVLETGFSGSIDRFFNPVEFRSVSGEVSGATFTPSHVLTVRLVKLHGSIAWLDRGIGQTCMERHPAALSPADRRVMVLPRRRKVFDTLAPPYDALFGLSSRAIGTECRYIASNGFSFGDDHINQTLLIPALQANKVRLFGLSREEPAAVSELKKYPAFSAAYEHSTWMNGVAASGGSDCWMFSKFVELFE
jgi:hypothetical protein